MKRFLALLALAAFTTCSYAYSFEVDGLYYDISSSIEKTVRVTYKELYYVTYYKSYSGNVVIPADVTYNGTTYSVTSIGEKAFEGCSGLTSVTIPNSVTFIGRFAFWYCSGLTSVTIPNSVTSIGTSAFSDCSSLTSVTIPNSITSIERHVFSRCIALSTINIPNSVTRIGDYAFYGCSGLTSITIPNSVLSIDNYAFYDCSGLTSVKNHANKPQRISSYTFSNYGTLHVLKGYRDVYSNTSYWSNFTIIDDLEGEVNAIAPINLQDNTNDKVYNLNGTRVNSCNLPVGTYIKNGKKVIVR